MDKLAALEAFTAVVETSGLGITSAPTFILSKHIQAKKLVPILQEYEKTAVGIYAVFPLGRLTPRRVQVFPDYLVSCFSDKPYWDDATI